MGYGYGFSYAKQKKMRELRERRKHTRNIPTERFLRVNVQVQLHSSNEVINGRALLHDLTPGGIGIFLESPLPRGEKVSIVLEYPRHLFVIGEVAWCALSPINSKILHVESFRYRVGFKFLFDTLEEAEAIGEYCASMAVTLDKR